MSRLTGQKGVGLIKHAAHRTVERGGQFVLLGSAPDPKVQVGVGRDGGRGAEMQRASVKYGLVAGSSATTGNAAT